MSVDLVILEHVNNAMQALEEGIVESVAQNRNDLIPALRKAYRSTKKLFNEISLNEISQ